MWLRRLHALALVATAAMACGGKSGDQNQVPTAPKRLTISGRLVLDENGQALELRGANLKDADDAAARDLKRNLRMNFVRLRLTYAPAAGTPSGLEQRANDELASWVTALAAEQIWVLLEVRSEDELTNDPALYQPGSPAFEGFAATWRYLAERFRQWDYVAGYGLLAEPSASRGDPEPADTLTRFQLALMDTISEVDERTPFFVGPDFNYDAMQFRYDEYHDALATYAGRIVYEVNLLSPKPWIQDGSVPVGVPDEAGAYPQPAPSDFDFAITPAAGEDLEAPRDLEKIFNQRRSEPENFPKLLNREFMEWYLHWTNDFAERHAVPVCVDQFGASTLARGQLDYERDALEVIRGNGFHFSRWAYNAGSDDRKIVGNQAVYDFYRSLP